MPTHHHRQTTRAVIILTLMIATMLSACDDTGEVVDSERQQDMGDTAYSLDATSIEDQEDLGAPDMARPDAGVIITRPRFDPRGVKFFDTPWPSDARLTDQGTPDLSLFPTTYESFVKILNEVEARVMGFATMPVIYVAFEGQISDLSLPTPRESLTSTSPIQVIALGDQCGLRIPVEIEVSVEATRYLPAETLQVKNTVGTTLEPGRAYALVVLRSWGVDQGRTVTAPEAFIEALEGDNSPWADSFTPLRACLNQADLSTAQLAVATVFTPQDPVVPLQAMRDLVMDPDRVETRPPQEVERDDAWSRKRLSLTTYSGEVPLPVFQRGETPYLNSGGGLVFEDSEPVVQRWEYAPFAVAMRNFPEDQPFAGPRPALVFIDGTGWTRWSHLRSRWLSEILDAGFVVFSFMPQFHGERAGVMGGPEVPTFNFFNPESGRVNFQQQALEISFFLRVIREQLVDLEMLPELDVSRVVYGGHSQGALAGALNAAVESGYAGYVFNGLSSYLTLTILERKDLLDFELVVRTLLDNGEPLDLFSPALQIMQLGSESVDPHNFARLWRGTESRPKGNHVFVINGYNDETTTPRGMDHLTISAGLPIFDAPGWEIDPFDLGTPPYVQLPLIGNETDRSGAPLTLATYLDPTTGHGTVYRNRTLRQMTIKFWQTALSEEMPRLEPENELMCSDEADGDQDGEIDCDDPDCMDREPCVELRCNDGQDADGDGLIDCDDPDCVDADACQEEDCGDGLDEDEDGLIDCDDPGCAEREPCVERLCRDAEDGDADGLIDCDDPDCQSRSACRETSCRDEVDNDDDGLIDCADPECIQSLACPEPACDDGTDEDANGRADCADPRCFGSEVCSTPFEERCDDTLDDDGDELVDCADPDCAHLCESETCADGDLGSLTGVAVFQGSLVNFADTWAPGDCTTLGSGGDAPDIALRWTAPADGVYLISTLGSAADTVLTLLSDDCETRQELACSDDRPGVTTSAISLTISEGQSVLVVISSFNEEDADTVVLHIEPEL